MEETQFIRLICLGLVGTTLHDEARADMIAECMRDVARPLVGIYSQSDPGKRVSINFISL